MCEYKEKTYLSSKLEKCNIKHRNFFDTSRPKQFKFVKEEMHSKVVQCFIGKPVVQLERMDAGYGNFRHDSATTITSLPWNAKLTQFARMYRLGK